MNPRLPALALALAFAAVGAVLLLAHARWFGGLSMAVGLLLAVYILTRARG